jgi:hypothetical protein
MNHCQICSRKIKDKSGIIAHHGYKRPEHGWQTESCMGARNLCYEKSRDIIPKAITSINLFVESKKYLIEQVKTGKVAVPSILSKTPVEPTHMFYKRRQEEYLAKLEYEIKTAVREIERLQKRYDEWKLIEVTQ